MKSAPYGWDKYVHVEVIPKPAPDERAMTLRWHLAVRTKTSQPEPGPHGTPATGTEEITMQLTADQQVDLSISGQDRYGNPVEISGDVVWESSDESIVAVNTIDDTHAVAVAVGPVGTAAVTVTNDADRDGTGDFMGSLAIDVVAGDIAEIEIAAGEPTDKPV